VSDDNSPDETLALSDAERQALIALLRHTLDEARFFPYAPRLSIARSAFTSEGSSRALSRLICRSSNRQPSS
jgi:hypothetical protein